MSAGRPEGGGTGVRAGDGEPSPPGGPDESGAGSGNPVRREELFGR